MGNDMDVRGKSHTRYIDRSGQEPTHKKGLINGKSVANLKNEVNAPSDRTTLSGVPEKLKTGLGSKPIGQINKTISKLLAATGEKEGLNLGLGELNSQVHVLSHAVKQMKQITGHLTETKANKKELATAKRNLRELEEKLIVFSAKRKAAALNENFGQSKLIMENSALEKNVAHEGSERADLKAQDLEIAENVKPEGKAEKQLTLELDEFLEALKDPDNRGVFNKIIEHIESSKEEIDSRYDDKNNVKKHEIWMQDMTKLFEDVTKMTEDILDSK